MSATRIERQHATNAIEQYAVTWLNSYGHGYDEGASGAAKDLFYGGCQSGIVSALIHTQDCVKFYRKHRITIAAMLAELMDSTGVKSPAELFGDKWDTSDPLATDDANQNLLAWFGFEEAARAVCDRAGIEF